MYYDLGRKELECPECGKSIEVTALLRPRRGRKPGTTNATSIPNPVLTKPEKKDKDLFVENLDLNTESENLDDDIIKGCLLTHNKQIIHPLFAKKEAPIG